MDQFYLASVMHKTEKKISRYNRLFEQLKKLLSDSPDHIAQIATINAILYHKIPYIFWVGFYFIHNNTLIVGPYQGPVACQSLPNPKGVCWQTVLDKKPIIVGDVNEFKDHIACDARSKSEIALPVFNKKGELIAVLDVDSDNKQAFDTQDEIGLTKILSLLEL